MQIDTYTKAVLTVIAIGVGLLVFDQKPVKDAQAGIGASDFMIAVNRAQNVWHMNENKVRYCRWTHVNKLRSLVCSGWK